jgi:hypothetical protein
MRVSRARCFIGWRCEGVVGIWVGMCMFFLCMLPYVCCVDIVDIPNLKVFTMLIVHSCANSRFGIGN